MNSGSSASLATLLTLSELFWQHHLNCVCQSLDLKWHQKSLEWFKLTTLRTPAESPHPLSSQAHTDLPVFDPQLRLKWRLKGTVRDLEEQCSRSTHACGCQSFDFPLRSEKRLRGFELTDLCTPGKSSLLFLLWEYLIILIFFFWKFWWVTTLGILPAAPPSFELKLIQANAQTPGKI